MSEIRKHVRRFNLDGRIELYDVDLAPVGGPVLRFTPMANIETYPAPYRATVNGGYTTGWVCQRMMPYQPAATSFLYIRLVVKKSAAAATFRVRVTNGAGSEGNACNFSAFDTTITPTRTRTGTLSPATSLTSAFTCPTTPDKFVMVFQTMGGTWFDRIVLADFAGMTSLDILSMEVYEEPVSGDLVHVFPDNNINSNNFFSNTATALPADYMGTSVRWKGLEYTPAPITAEGFQMSSDGQMARPKLTMTNILNAATNLIKTYGDLAGAKVTKQTTFRRFLDDGMAPDPSANIPNEVYFVDQMVKNDRESVEWELASVLDQQGVLLPARQVIRTACQLTYRTWDAVAGAFDYTNVSCPYSGASMFRANQSTTTNPAQDVCSQTVAGCKKRFPTGDLKFGGFPSAGRIRR